MRINTVAKLIYVQINFDLITEFILNNRER